MDNRPESDKTFEDFLLGKLTPQTEMDIEASRCDPDVDRRVRLAESSLIERYAFGLLSSDEERLFQRNMLPEEDVRERVATLVRQAARGSAEPEDEAPQALPVRTESAGGFWANLQAAFWARPVWAMAGVAALVVAAIWVAPHLRRGPARIAEIDQNTRDVRLADHDEIALSFRHPDNSPSAVSRPGSLPPCKVSYNGETHVFKPDEDGRVRIVIPSKVLSARTPVLIDCGSGPITPEALQFRYGLQFR